MTSAALREFRFERRDFEFISTLIKERTGIVLADNKQDMVYGRLSRRLRAVGMTSFRDYCDYIVSADGRDEFSAFLNALTTNLTRFFREAHHFEHLAQTVLEQKAQAAAAGGERRLRIWSAGSSSGEEPYTAAMVVADALRDLDKWDARILATDIDTNMLEKCRTGIYRSDRVEAIAPPLRKRFVEPVPGSSNEVRMTDTLRSLIVFKQLNLLGRWPMKGPFDVIFCRNVSIYFDRPTQKRLFERFASLLADDGFLYIGHAENLFNITDRFKLIGQTIYRKA